MERVAGKHLSIIVGMRKIRWYRSVFGRLPNLTRNLRDLRKRRFGLWDVRVARMGEVGNGAKCTGFSRWKNGHAYDIGI